MEETSKKYRNIISKLANEKVAHEKDNKQKDREYSILESKFNTLQIEHDKLDTKFKLLQKGFNWYVLNDDNYIVASGHVLGGFVTTYEQPLPSNVNNGCYKLSNGTVELDKEKYRKLGGL